MIRHLSLQRDSRDDTRQEMIIRLEEELFDSVRVEKKMVSEDVEKILALIIVTLSFLSLPVLLFLFFVVLYVDVTYVIRFHYTRDFIDGLVATGLAVVSVGLFFVLRFLAKWIRKK